MDPTMSLDRLYEELARINDKLDRLTQNFGQETLPRLATLEQWSRGQNESCLKEGKQLTIIIDRLDKAERIIERWSVGVAVLVLAGGAAITGLVGILLKGKP